MRPFTETVVLPSARIVSESENPTSPPVRVTISGNPVPLGSAVGESVGVVVAVGEGVRAVVATGEDVSAPAFGSSLPQPTAAKLRQLNSSAPDRMYPWSPRPRGTEAAAEDLEHD
jgi:hypothetical protein